MINKKRLGDILVESGFITEEELKQALGVQKESDMRLGRVMIDMGLITEVDVVEALEYQLGIPQIDLKKFVINPSVINLISKELAEKVKAIPIHQEGNNITVAMADPLDVVAIDDIRIKTSYNVNPVVATETEIQHAIDQYFSNDEVVEELMHDIDSKTEKSENSQNEINRLLEMVDNAPIVRLVNNIINDGIKLRASDIHIEPKEEQLKVRYRVDGILHNEMQIPKNTHAALVSRIKIMADLDIAERRIPQDGRFQMEIDNNRQVDLRVSTLPTVKGEKVVLRILDKSNLMLSIDDLGFLPEHKKLFTKMINQAHGMILITGPTGSGKTTTLYSALNALDTENNNIITVEDPVEYRLEDVNQVQTKAKAGLTFANSLRAILRQDPDIIMVGEIRDEETAEIAVHAALTGHLVLSTLHTNEAAGALSRLIDMGVAPFLVASSVMGVVAQRLVRKICPSCKKRQESSLVSPDLKDYLGEEEVEIYKGEGCRACNETGYRGRTAIHEILDVSNEIKKLIVKNASAAEIGEVAAQEGMISLEKSGLTKLKQGITTAEEVMRVTKVHFS